jgi:3-keto-L-gulonate-6-phosphate decarboxylase
MDSEAMNSKIIYSSGKDASAVTAVIEEHTVRKIKQEGNKKNSEASSSNFLLCTKQNA